MLEKDVKNKFAESFRVLEVKNRYNNIYERYIKIPAGLTKDELDPLRKIIECNLAGDTILDWKKNDGKIVIIIDKNRNT